MYVQVEMMSFLDREWNIKIFHIYPNQIVNIKSGRGVHLKKIIHFNEERKTDPKNKK